MGDRSLQKTSSPNAPRHTGILLSHLLDLHLDLHHDAAIAPHDTYYPQFRHIYPCGSNIHRSQWGEILCLLWIPARDALC